MIPFGMISPDRVRCLLRGFSVRWFWICLGSLLLSGCLSQPGTEVPASYFVDRAVRLEAQAQQDIQSNTLESAVENYRQAHKIYASLDHGAGRARTTLALAGLYDLLGDQDQSRLRAQQALEVAQSLPGQPALFRIHLLLGKLDHDKDAFQKALDQAQSPLEKAMALVYLNRVEEAWQQIREETPVTLFGDYAFVWYAYGKHRKDASAVEQALVLYKKGDHVLGVSNALYLLGRIFHAQGDIPQARAYLERALAVNRALERPRRIQAVEHALRTLQDAETAEHTP